MIRRTIILCQAVTLLLTLALTGISWSEDQPVKIGVLAKRGVERCLAKWSPTATYLTARISGARFVIVPLDYAQIYEAVGNREVDFILSNPSFYVELESWYGVNRIATLKNIHFGIDDYDYDQALETLQGVLQSIDEPTGPRAGEDATKTEGRESDAETGA